MLPAKRDCVVRENGQSGGTQIAAKAGWAEFSSVETLHNNKMVKPSEVARIISENKHLVELTGNFNSIKYRVPNEPASRVEATVMLLRMLGIISDVGSGIREKQTLQYKKMQGIFIDYDVVMLQRTRT